MDVLKNWGEHAKNNEINPIHLDEEVGQFSHKYHLGLPAGRMASSLRKVVLLK